MSKYYTIENAYDMNEKITVYENGIMKFYTIVRVDSVQDCEKILDSLGYSKRYHCSTVATMDTENAKEVINNALNRGYATSDDIRRIAKSLNIDDDIFSDEITSDNLFDNNMTIKLT